MSRPSRSKTSPIWARKLPWLLAATVAAQAAVALAVALAAPAAVAVAAPVAVANYLRLFKIFAQQIACSGLAKGFGTDFARSRTSL